MEMNSYGDLLTLYYNNETNPVPSFAGNSEASNSTRNAVAYPFNEITDIAVDARKYLYVVERLPLERQENDSKAKLALSQVVLRFDENKKFINYIGQQGPGGTPFSYVKKIYTTDKNELVVVCTTPTGMTVYWYSDDGFLLYTIPVEKQNIPNPYIEESNDYFVNSITGFTNIDLVTAKWETKDKKKLPKNSLYRRTIALRDEYDKYITTMAKMRGTDVNSFINSLIKKEN